MMQEKVGSILIVDDEEDTCLALTNIFRLKGYETDFAMTAREALAKVQAESFDVVLVDIRLPDVQGIELVGLLEEVRPGMAVIIVTAHGSLDTAIQAMERGTAAYITKPVDVDRLLETVESATEKQRLLHENRRLYEAAQRELAERQRAEAELRKAHDELEKKVEERTAELKGAVQALQETEERFRGLVESTSDWLWEVDANGVYTYASPNITELLGYEPEEVLGKTPFDLMPPDEAERIGSAFQELAESKQPLVRLENVNLHRDGRRIVLETSGVPILDAEGNLSGYRGIDRDITEHKQVDENLEWESGLNQAMAEVASEVLSARPPDDISALVLSHARRITNSPLGYVGYIDEQTGYLVCPTMAGDVWDRCEVEGKRIVFQEFTGLGGWVLNNQEPLMTNSPAEEEASRGTPPGHVPIERFLSAPAVFADTLFGQVAVANASRDYNARDLVAVTQLAALYAIAVERKRAEQQLRLATEELRRSNEELEQFAYVASHDLKEPLRVVANYVDLLAERYEGKLDSDADDFIGYAKDAAERMSAMISDLLRYSRVGTRGRELAPTNCEAAFESALANLQMNIEETHAEIGQDPLPTVMADETQLLQLFQNLISNAIKFRAAGPPQIHVSATPAAELQPSEQRPHFRDQRLSMWRFSVRDNGIGIDPQQFERIFMVFQRLHTRDEYPGTGIGLAVCKKIVERHGGHIWAESEPGKGATFYFTLPAGEE